MLSIMDSQEGFSVPLGAWFQRLLNAFLLVISGGECKYILELRERLILFKDKSLESNKEGNNNYISMIRLVIVLTMIWKKVVMI